MTDKYKCEECEHEYSGEEQLGQYCQMCGHDGVFLIDDEYWDTEEEATVGVSYEY